MPKEKLDQQRIRQLLQAADERWYASHSGQFKYQEHLDFVAAYIAKHYRAPELGRRVEGHAQMPHLSKTL